MITPERWQRVKEIFLSVQSSTPAERDAFLDQACEGDEVIRAEVESLLAADATDDDAFLNVPAYEMVAEMLVEQKPEFVAGEAIGPYTIVSLLDFGGMGDVYLARDARLDRQIALKVISPDFAKDEARIRRFEREARAVSTLNHPNVCVIHEVGVTKEGRHFMAMEFIDGVTLRRRMSQRKLTLKEVLDVGAQVAWALEAAHAAGIVHRDIKPENIMVRRDGYVKVLDFSIAKLSAPKSMLRDVHGAETTARFETSPGMLVGTAKYMSPEQLREQPVDQRSDIWSLGVVLHELVTGVTPFEAHSTNETIAVILEKQQPQLSFESDKVPEEFQQLVRKALSKKRRERYQTISELSSDLGRLRRQLSAEALDRPLEPATRPIRTSNLVESRNVGAVTTILSKVRSQVSSTAEYVFGEIKQHKTVAFAGATVVLVLLLFVIPDKPPPPLPPPTPARTTMAPLTNAGTSVCAAISPDGKHVAHVEEKDGNQKVVYASLETAGTSTLVPAADVKYLGLTFSRDGQYLYFTRTDRSDTSTLYGDAGNLYQVSLPGGAARRIANGVSSPITFSPNGDRFSFVRFDKPEYSLVVANADGTGERVLAKRRDENTFSIGGPAWSPDGETIVCAAGKWDNGHHMNLVAFDVKDGHETWVSTRHWFSVLQVAWLQDKTGLIISARERWAGPYQLWQVSYPQGEPVPITSDTNEYRNVSLSSDGKTIVSVRNQQDGEVWVAPDGDTSRAKQIDSMVGRVYGMNWTSRGKIVYSAMAGSNLSILTIDPDGANKTVLTVNAGDNYTPATSPDGRYIVFASNRKGALNIWRMNAEDGSDPKQLTFTDGNSYPSVSFDDGQWVVYDNQSNADYTLWKVSIDGGTPVRLSEPEKNAHMAAVSPDNQFLACRYFVDDVTEKIVILPSQGGEPVRSTGIRIREWQRIQWSPDGRALAYIETVRGVSNIASYDLNSNSTRQITTFNSGRIFAYAWSPDHKTLACVRGGEVRDVMVVSPQP